LKIDIYTSAINGNKYLSVAKGTKVETLALPDSIDTDVRTLSPFKTRLEIDHTKEHPALDHQDIIEQIEQKGFAVHGAKRVITIDKSST